MNVSCQMDVSFCIGKLPFLCGPKTIVASKMFITHMETKITEMIVADCRIQDDKVLHSNKAATDISQAPG